ncbi:MAG: AAA family ATPase, partial [Clostridia bacterium]|nr:AAA family ATPase [Clostridia bacterium]
IVHIDAEDEREYRMRVAALYEWLRKNGIPIDPQNRNPSRLSRMPGVTRNGKRQRLVAVNIGKKSWNEWREYLRTLNDALPEMVRLADVKDHPPTLPEELISGILRMGHKMLISGPSKAGKSFLLMELCIAIAEGIFWLGFQCRKGRVLYINLEIDPASAIDRFLRIYRAMGVPMNHAEDIVIWNLRGHAEPLDRLVPKLIRRIQGEHYDAVVLDPIYKVITGDENSASDMGAFCNQFDKICTAAGCAAIYCHHHSKGAQGMKKAMDRASGSGVFARDPDAQLDIIELEMTEEVQCHAAETRGTAWRLETSLREFPNIVPMEFWFEYPLHRVDKWEELKKLPAQGTFEAGKVKNKCHKTAEEAKEEFRNAFALQCINRKEVPMSDMMELLDIGESAIYNRVKKLGDEFKIENKIIKRLEPQENQGPEGTEEANSKPRKKAGTKARKTNARNPRKIKALGQKKRINNFIIPSWVYIYP